MGEFGSIAEVARQTGTAEAYLSQILNAVPLPSGRPRGVGDALARKLESGCGKPASWMDHMHTEPVVIVREVGMDEPPLTLEGPDTERAIVSSPEELAAFLGGMEAEELLRVVRMALEQYDKKQSRK